MEGKQTNLIWKQNIKCTGAGNKNYLMGNIPCGKDMQISEADVFVTQALNYEGEQDLYYSVKCSDCGCTTDICEKLVPEDVKALALKKYSDKKKIRFIDSLEK